MRPKVDEKDRYRCVFEASYKVINLESKHLDGRYHPQIVIDPDGDDADDIRERYRDPRIAVDAENRRVTVRMYDSDAVSLDRDDLLGPYDDAVERCTEALKEAGWTIVP